MCAGRVKIHHKNKNPLGTDIREGLMYIDKDKLEKHF